MPAARHCLESGALNLDDLVRRDLASLRGRRVLVIGDLMLDRYVWGSVERTTPEAPVPVVRRERETWALGGPANVARNVLALGGRAEVIGVVGCDADGALLREGLREAGIGAAGLIALADRPTTVKTRVVSRGQQLLRLDLEETSPLPATVQRHLIAHIARRLPRCNAVILSDYSKGVVSRAVVEAAVSGARRASVPVLVDPKGQDYTKYRGADILTPNQREVAQAAGCPVAANDDLRRAGRDLIRRCALQALVVTLGPEGLAVMRPGRRVLRMPARAPEVFDETGAGDTTIAALALGLSAGLSLEDAAALANHAGGIVVGKFGVATVSPAELKASLEGRVSASKVRPVAELRILLANLQARGRKIVFTNGCFDLLHPGHIRFLHEARRLGDVLVVGLNTDRSVRALKGPPRPILLQDERAAILSALTVVDYVVFFDELTPESLLRQLRPDILVKGRNIPENEVVGHEIVRAYGGQVRRLPILHAATVTDLVDSILGRFKTKGKKPRTNTDERR